MYDKTEKTNANMVSNIVIALYRDRWLLALSW